MRQPVHALAFEVPLALTDHHHGAVDGGGIDAVHVEGLDELERLPLQRTHVGGADDVEAAALGGLHLVDDFFVGADAGEIDRDTGFLGEFFDPFQWQIV